MSKIYNSGRIGLVLMGFSFFLSFNSAYASVVINEVQVKPTGESFVELFNSGAPQDLTGWSIKRKTSSGTEYSLVSASRLKDKSIAANSYFLLANEDYAGNIALDATWAKSYNLANDNSILLSNADGILIDKVGWGDANDCPSPCLSNPPDGQSIQRTTLDSWITATPTPGQANQSSSSSSSGGDTGSSNTTTSENSSSSTAAVEPKPKTTTNPTMKAKIVASNLAFAGQPFVMKADISGFSNENVLLGRVYWNFGDGVSLEQVNNFEKFYHIYHYPGDYVVLVEYYRNNFSETPDATAKMIIKAISTTVTISKVGDANDFFIELSNNASSDIDVSNWVISANGKTFSLPKNSVIMSKKQMTISGKVTGFTYGDQFNLKLFSSTGEMVFDYSPTIIPPSPVQTASRQLTPVSATTQFPEDPEEDTSAGDIDGENLFENLSASASLSDVTQENADNSYMPIVASFIFIGASAGAVYFIRQRRNPLKVGDDFKILDE